MLVNVASTDINCSEPSGLPNAINVPFNELGGGVVCARDEAASRINMQNVARAQRNRERAIEQPPDYATWGREKPYRTELGSATVYPLNE
jgi:hypothetical protein